MRQRTNDESMGKARLGRDFASARSGYWPVILVFRVWVTEGDEMEEFTTCKICGRQFNCKEGDQDARLCIDCLYIEPEGG